MSKKTIFLIFSTFTLLVLTCMTTLSFVNYKHQEDLLNYFDSNAIYELEEQQPLYYEYANQWELHRALDQVFNGINGTIVEPLEVIQSGSQDALIQELAYHMTTQGDLVTQRRTLINLLEDPRYIYLHSLELNMIEETMSVTYSLFNNRENYV